MSLRSEFRVVMSATISAYKRSSARLYLLLFVGGRMSYLRYLCLLSYYYISVNVGVSAIYFFKGDYRPTYQKSLTFITTQMCTKRIHSMFLHPLIRQSLVQQSLVQLASLFLFLLKIHLQYLRKGADNICMHFGDCVYIESNKSTINIVKHKPFTSKIWQESP